MVSSPVTFPNGNPDGNFTVANPTVKCPLYIKTPEFTVSEAAGVRFAFYRDRHRVIDIL